MWVIGIVVCAALMLGSHAAMSTGHGSHSHEPAAAVQPAQTAAERDGGSGRGGAEERATADVRISLLNSRNER